MKTANIMKAVCVAGLAATCVWGLAACADGASASGTVSYTHLGSFGFREVRTSASPGQPFEIPCEKCLTKPLILGYSIQALFYGPVAQLVRAHA